MSQTRSSFFPGTKSQNKIPVGQEWRAHLRGNLPPARVLMPCACRLSEAVRPSRRSEEAKEETGVASTWNLPARGRGSPRDSLFLWARSGPV